MLILYRLDPLDVHDAKAYRLQVKERLYRFNFVGVHVPISTIVLICLEEILAQLEKQERLDKLEETFQNVQDDYQRILKMAGFA